MKNNKLNSNSNKVNKNKKRKVPVVVVLFFWLLAILAVCGVAAYALWNYEISPMTDSGEEEKVELISIPSGMTVTQAAEILEEKNLIHSAKLFYYAARFNVFDRNSTFSLRRGDYNVSSAMSMKEIYFLLQLGSQQSVTVRIPEGLTIKKVARLIEEAEVCNSQDFIIACHDRELLSEFGIEADSCEGFLFPDTYYLTKEMDSIQVVRRILENFVDRTSGIEGFDSYKGKELFELITLASIVEREYKVDSEAPVIASVFKNRIKSDIKLQSCATIEHIITEIQGKPHPEKILYSDLEIQNPYNTYMNAGLTPGPISNPGLVAINATVHPADTDYYYFVLTDPDAGTHTFSKTFNQHKAASNTNYVSK